MKGVPAPGRVRIASTEGWFGAAVEALEAALSEALRSRGDPVHVGLSGGSTPEPVYRTLAERKRIDLGRLVVLTADERFVAADDGESNHRMIREALGDDGALGPRMPFFGWTEGRRLPEATGALARALPHRLDLLVLGIGADGHTASLFPGDPRLLEFGIVGAEEAGSESREAPTAALALAVDDAPKPPSRRVSISPVVITRARRALVLARGASKADAVRRALQGAWDPVGTPAQWARPGDWILDPGAASALQ